MANTNSIVGRMRRTAKSSAPVTDDPPPDPRCPECGTIGATKTPLLKPIAKKWARWAMILIFALFALRSAMHCGPGVSRWNPSSTTHIGTLDLVRHICPEPVTDEGALALVSHIKTCGFEFEPGDAHYSSSLDVSVTVRPLRYGYERPGYVTIWGWPATWGAYNRDFPSPAERAPPDWQISSSGNFLDLTHIYFSDRGQRRYLSLNLPQIALSFCLLIAFAWCISAIQRRLRLQLLAFGFVLLLWLVIDSTRSREHLSYFGANNGAFLQSTTGFTATDLLSLDPQTRVEVGRRIAGIFHQPQVPKNSRILVHYESRYDRIQCGAGLGVPLGLVMIETHAYPSPDPVPASLRLTGSSLEWSSAHSGTPWKDRLNIWISFSSLAYYLTFIIIAGWIIRIAIWQVGKRIRPKLAQPRFTCRKCGYDLANLNNLQEPGATP